MVLAVGLSCWLVLGKCWSRTGGPRSGTVVLVLGKCWCRTGGPCSGTVALVGFREVLEQDWRSSQWDCGVVTGQLGANGADVS